MKLVLQTQTQAKKKKIYNIFVNNFNYSKRKNTVYAGTCEFSKKLETYRKAQFTIKIPEILSRRSLEPSA